MLWFKRRKRFKNKYETWRDLVKSNYNLTALRVNISTFFDFYSLSRLLKIATKTGNIWEFRLVVSKKMVQFE